MTIRASDALLKKILDGGSGGGIKGALNDCLCAIFSGSQPASGNTGAAAGTLLGLVSVEADGTTPLTWDAAVAGVIAKAAAELWQAKYSAAGVAGWFRFHISGDPLTTTDATKLRLDGSCGTSGADLNMSNLTTVVDRVDTVDGFTVTLPSGA